MDLPGPPVKTRGRLDHIRLPLQRDTVSQLHLLQLLDRGEMLVDEHRIGERPQMLGRLEFGGIRREEEQMDMLGYPQAHTRMPAGPVEDQHDLLGRTGSGRAGKGSELGFKERNTDTGRQMKEGAPRSGMDKADEVAPDKAVLDDRYRSLANRRPHAPLDRFEPDAMFVGGPQFHARLWEGGGYGSQKRANVFLNCFCSSGSANACCDRGSCRLFRSLTR